MNSSCISDGTALLKDRFSRVIGCTKAKFGGVQRLSAKTQFIQQLTMLGSGTSVAWIAQ
jgi:hypothetical protein